MMRILVLPLLAAGALSLGGCVAGMAASAVGMAVKSAQGTPENNALLSPDAAEACRSRAAQYGAVKLIDMQQTSPSKIVVWGTVDNGTKKQSFECSFGTKIKGFKLRPITPQG